MSPLTYVCNLSLTSGVFPDKMKLAKVLPIFKGGDKHIFTNYRPVSLLPQCSKVLEKLFNIRLNEFVTKHSILCPNQYGFRKGHSTALALAESVEVIKQSLERNLYVLGIFIDLRKAFDTINHEILIEKLYNYGVRDNSLEWIRSYLLNRTQYVQVGEAISSHKRVSCGVPQGSILGPQLFLLYINDIVKVSEAMWPILYADDTNILCSGKDLGQLIDSTNQVLENLHDWFNANKLSLNLQKTKFMLFGKRSLNENIILRVNDQRLERVTEFKMLGVIMDNLLTWKPQIAAAQKNLASSVSVLWKVRNLLNYSSLRSLYYGLVDPRLCYCAEIWGQSFKSNLWPLIKLQKRSIRILHHKDNRAHTNDLFKVSEILKVPEIIDYHMMQIVHRAYIENLPTNLQRMFTLCEDIYNLRGKVKFKVNKCKTTRMKQGITCQGIRLWNDLPLEIKHANSFKVFKRELKKRFISKY